MTRAHARMPFGRYTAARRLRLLVVALVAASLLGGCVGLQSHGPVRQGLEVGGPAGDPVTVLPPGPEPGASPGSIITGFLRAGAASQGDMSVAREFLTDSLAPTWNPDAGTTIIGSEASVKVTPVGAGTFQLSADVAAMIDDTGQYQYAQPGTTRRAVIGMQHVDGEWRISSLPEGFGRWIDSSVISRLFRPFNIYYVAVGSNILIPDVRWLPLDRQSTRLARAQLAPVPDYLQGAAKSYLATGIRLTVDAVPVNDGVATVDLSAAGLPPEPSARKNIWAQLVATLTQAADVVAVNVTVEGATLDLPDVTPPVSSVSELGVSLEPSAAQASAVVRVQDKVVPVEPSRLLNPGDKTLANAKSKFPSIPSAWNRIAESRSGEEIAAVGTDGGDLARWRTDETIEAPFFATDLTRPTYDRHDILWVGGKGVGKSKDVRLWAINTAADPKDTARSAPQPIRAPWLKNRVVRAVHVSPDGQRIALVTTDAHGKDARIDMAGILRQPNGVPKGLSPVTRQIAPYLSDDRDLAWISTTTVAVLGRIDASSPVQPFVLEIGGQREALPAVPAAQAITTTGGERGLVVMTSKGRVFLRAGQTWLPTSVGSDFAVPGQ